MNKMQITTRQKKITNAGLNLFALQKLNVWENDVNINKKKSQEKSQSLDNCHVRHLKFGLMS